MKGPSRSPPPGVPLGNSHVGALVETAVVQTITIRPNGSAAVDAEILFDNGAGTDPPSVLLGRPVGGLPIGTFAADVTLYLPKTADKIEAETSRPSPIGWARPRTCHRDGFDRGAGRWIHVAHGGLRCPRRRSHGERREGDHPPGAAATDDSRGPLRDPGGPPGGVDHPVRLPRVGSARRHGGVLRNTKGAVDLDLRFGLGKTSGERC